jgi:hypothetical protein
MMGELGHSLAITRANVVMELGNRQLHKHEPEMVSISDWQGLNYNWALENL